MAHSHNDSDPTCVSSVLNSFRCTGTPNRLETPSVVAKLHFDSDLSSENMDTKKRRLSHEADLSRASSISMETSVTDSTSETRRLKKELMEARALIVSLETRVSQLHALRRELEIVFEAEKNSLLQQQERDRNLVQDLELRVKKLRQREGDARSGNAEKWRTLEQDKYRLEKRLQTLQQENAKLADAVVEAKQLARQNRRAGDDNLEELERSLCSLREELALEKERSSHDIHHSTSGWASNTAQMEQMALELSEAQRKIKDLESQREDTHEAMEMVRSQQRKLLRLPELERELERLRDDNARLRDAVQNKMLLEEEVMDLRIKCSSSNEREKQLVQVEAQLKLLESQLTEWRKVASDFCPNVTEKDLCARAVRNRIQELQQTELLLTSEISELHSMHKTSAHKLSQAESQVNQLTQALTAAKAVQEQQVSLIRRCQKKVALLTGERNSYREQLDCYEKELTVSVSSHQQNSSQSRIEALEKSLQGYRDLVENLESELATATGHGGSGGLSEKLRQITAERNALRQERDTLQKRCDDLELEMEHRVLKGDFNPSSTRILHFKMNPSATAEAAREDEITALKSEVARLRERVRILQEGEQDDITCKVNQRLACSNSQEVEELREQIKSAELMKQRLKEAFKKTSQEFRDCVYQLLGYKVDRLQNKGGLFRLSSMYADSPNDYLLFKMLPNGTLTLLETSFSASLQELIDLHLHHHRSLPLFLASLTSELFSRQSVITPNTTALGDGSGNDDDAIVLLD